MEVDHPVIPELKRKLTPPQPAPEVDPEKKAKLAEEEKTEQEKEAENKKAVNEAPITAEDIRKLKELLRQEEAKLLLIKR